MTAVLAIDTAAARLQLALLRPDGRCDCSIDDIGTGHAEMLFDRIAALLTRNGLDYAGLTHIGVTTGPGSFTGLRIGLSAARGLGLALSIPVIGVPSLMAVALAAPAGAAVAVIVDARRGEAYRQLFAADFCHGPAQLVPLEAARFGLDGDTMVITEPFPDIERLARFVASADPAVFPPEPDYVRDADAKPQALKAVARLAAAS
jgi:tRNA threonylcarbamoyladenosine biosynthesis protein TsaB